MTVSSFAMLALAGELAARYRISALARLLASVRASCEEECVRVAVVGRFKAGKSSFLNHFLGRQILPTGVTPVTAVITEIRCGAREGARVHYLDGSSAEIPLTEIAHYVSEKENPDNARQVSSLTVELTGLRRFAGLTFADTPGLESALAHNSRTSLEWLPNVGLALVAVSVDPPLSERDLELLRQLYRYTPKVAILLTKVDLVNAGELAELLDFIRAQLARHLPESPPIFPYSIKPGFEQYRDAFAGAMPQAADRESIVTRKLDTLFAELSGFLAFSCKAAEAAQSERDAFRRQLAEEKEAGRELLSTVRLVVERAAAGTRAIAAVRLESHQSEVERKLLASFESQWPKWGRSLATMLSWFEVWLADALRAELAGVSVRERGAMLVPLAQVRKQAQRALQQFRDRLSESTERLFGAPLRTTESEIEVREPAAPDVRIGRIFDRNWELLSPILPARLIRGIAHGHFARTISYLLYENLSRLAAQWEDSIRGALRGVETEARERLDELLLTVERLAAVSGGEQIRELRADCERVEAMRRSLGATALSLVSGGIDARQGYGEEGHHLHQ